jgi:16S rRNA (uracil1498-N3)-methyltransferase
MHRFFVEHWHVADDDVQLGGEIAHQVIRVLRLGAGDTIALFSGDGAEVQITITSIHAHTVQGSVRAITYPATEVAGHVELGLALIQASKFELVLQKATELGVTAVQPVLCALSRSSGADRVTPDRTRRWSRLLREAAEQSGRVRLPLLHEPATLPMVLRAEMPTLLLHPNGETSGVPWQHLTSAMSLRILVGPEGGFTDDEVATAVATGAHAVRLGCRIMRVETAAIAALTLVIATREDWGATLSLMPNEAAKHQQLPRSPQTPSRRR